MEYNFDLSPSRRGTSCQKWDITPPSTEEGAPPMIPMGIADMDFPCPEPVVNAIHRRADRLVFGYTGYDKAYHDSVISYYDSRFGWKIEDGDLFHLNGVVPGIEAAVKIFTEETDGVIVQTPVYDPFFEAVTKHGRHLVFNRLIETDGCYTMDLEGLEALAADPANTMMILCSPHNPSGRVWKEEELQAVLDICRCHGVLLVCDEIHCDLVRRGMHHRPILTLAGKDDRVIAFNAPSKTFNIPGLHMANAVIANRELRAVWQVKKPFSWPNPLSLAAATAAYGESFEWLEQMLEYLDGNFVFMKEYLDKHLPELGWDIPEGTYLAWLDCRNLPISAPELQKRLATEAGVFLVDGTCYKGEGFLRMNIGCPRSLLAEALERICRFIASL